MNNEMRVLGPDGDLKVMWDPNKQEEVDAAKKQYEELIKKNYLAFSVKDDGERGDKLSKFDPSLRKIIMTPMVRGG